jgi:glycosyltransferase involved in cell wall biosynthesis
MPEFQDSDVSVSVVISAFAEERWPSTMAAIESARSQTLRPCEVIVCIDHNPVVLERARGYAEGRSNVIVVANVRARGVSGARNTGAALARGRVIAFLDDDAEAAPDWLACLARAYTDSTILGVGGSIEPLWVNGRPEWFPEEFLWVVGCSYRGLPVQAASTRNLIGANMSFRRDVFELVGGFREDIGRVGHYPPIGCEDTALCIRARRLWPMGSFIYEPRARVRHSVPFTRTRWGYFLSRCFGEGSSKAHLAHLFGLTDSLALERTYVTRTLPIGLVGALSDALLRRQMVGLARGGAILAGLASAGVGFVRTVAVGRPLAASQLTAEVAS